jgi:hypothetical protein
MFGHGDTSVGEGGIPLRLIESFLASLIHETKHHNYG